MSCVMSADEMLLDEWTLTVRTRDHRDDVVVRVEGELDIVTSPELHVHLSHLLRHRQLRSLVVDLAGLSFMGLAGLKVLLAAQQSADLHDVELRVVTCPRIRRPIAVTGAQSMFDLYDSVGAALAASRV